MGIKKALCGFAAAALTAALPVADVLNYPLLVTAVAEEAAAESAELREGDYSYIENEDGATVTLTKYNGSDTKVEIPKTLGGKPITEIGWMSFAERGTLESVTIPEGVKVIDEGAFLHCSSLTGVTLPDSVTEIETSAFYGSSLKRIDVPRGVTKISERAFNGCTALEAIDVDESNANFSSVDGVLFNKGKTVILRYPIGKGNTTYKIPDGVMEVGENTFRHCESLTSITIPDGVTKISDSAFESCIALTSIDIPDSVTEIGESAFTACLLKSITIPAGVTEISNSAFFSCKTLKSITIPAGVTKIGSQGFFGCISLENITIPNSVKEIGKYIFEGCIALENVYYGGTQEQWSAVDIDDDNEALKSLQIKFIPASSRPAVPSSSGSSMNSSTFQLPSGDTYFDTTDTEETEGRVSDGEVKSAVDAVNSGAASRDIKVSDSVTLTIDKGSVKSIDTSKSIVFSEKLTAENPDKTVRGTAAKSFTAYNAGNAKVSVKLDGAKNGEFANVYKINGASGKAELAGVAKIVNGTAGFALNGNGGYTVMTGKYSDLKGDADNDGVLSAKDAVEILKDIAKMKNAANNENRILDFNSDGKVSAQDAVLLLKQIAGIN